MIALYSSESLARVNVTMARTSIKQEKLQFAVLISIHCDIDPILAPAWLTSSPLVVVTSGMVTYNAIDDIFRKVGDLIC
jgi:hypothetical protein